jgi:hypothetical protein
VKKAERSRADLEAAYLRALAVKQAHEAELLGKANVLGVGVGLRQRRGKSTGEVALVVMVREKLRPEELAAEDLIPAEIDAVPVDVLPVGEIRAGD